MRSSHVVSNPPLARWLFDNTEIAWIWLIVRVYLGWQWLTAGWEKANNPAWTQSGLALKGFWASAVGAAPGSKPLIVFGWYRDFIQAMLAGGQYVWFAKLVTFGELAVGIALIVGAFVGWAAFFGALMNWSYMLAGVASTNPLLFVLAIVLMLAWKTAGYWGADRLLLPLVGTPWPSPADVVEPQSPRQGAPWPQPDAGTR